MVKKNENIFKDDFASAFHFSSIGKAIVSLDGKWLKVNSALCDMLGFAKEELFNLKFNDITHPNDLELDHSLLEDMLRGEINTYQIGKRYFTKNKSIIHVILNVSLVRNKKNSPKYFIFQIQDITSRVKAEQGRQLILETTFDGFWDWDIVTNYQYMSPRFWEMFGYKPYEKEHSPEEWKKIMFEEDLQIALDNFDLHVKTRGEYPYKQEVRYRHKDGSTVWVLCRGKVVEWDEKGNPLRMVGMHTDITQLRVHKQESLNSAKMAAVGRLAGGIAHEINNPLAIILSNTHLLKKYLDHNSPRIENSLESVELIEKTVKRAANIVDGLKILIGKKSSIKRETFLLKEALDSVILISSSQFKVFDISIENNVPNDIVIQSNLTQFSQVIVNLLNNSFDEIKHHEKPWIRFEADCTDKFVNLKVIDCGKGISNEIAKKIMEPFFTTKETGKGSGLGLSLSRQMIENLGGKLYYNPTHQNTCFIIQLPYEKIAAMGA